MYAVLSIFGATGILCRKLWFRGISVTIPQFCDKVNYSKTQENHFPKVGKLSLTCFDRKTWTEFTQFFSEQA